MPSLEFSKSNIISFHGMKKACFQRHVVGCAHQIGVSAVLPRSNIHIHIYVYIASRFYPCERILSHIPRTIKN